MRFIRAGVANSDTIAIAVTGAGDSALIEIVYRWRRAGGFIASVNRHAARAERYRLRGTAITSERLQIDLRSGRLGCVAAGSVICKIVAVRGERGIVIAISTQRAVGDDGVLERGGADVVDDTAASASAIAGEGAVCHIQQRAAVVVKGAAAIAHAIAGEGAVG